MKKLLLFNARLIAGIILFALTATVLLSISPIYRFEEPKPFSGPDIFNPYESLDTAIGWKRANFHTHTKVKGLFNECAFWPAQVDSAYREFGYDIVTFSNHNALTQHPYDPSLQVNVYEHGYNLFKYHKLVFGCSKVNRFDNIFPLLTSQKQFQLDLLGRDADFIQMNHPFRTIHTTRSSMELLTGYRITELDSGVSTEQEYWDWSLSAGHYTFALANDDLHHPDFSDCIARRCNMMNCNGATYGELKETLLGGAYYCMRIPDFGNGDWTEKYRGNAHLPVITDIGMDGDTIFIVLSEPARYIKVTGQNHTTLDSIPAASSMRYAMKPGDTYARMTAFFENGTVIYTNPFARYDASVTDTPYTEPPHPVNIPLTILFNLAVLALAYGCFRLMISVVRPRRRS